MTTPTNNSLTGMKVDRASLVAGGTINSKGQLNGKVSNGIYKYNSGGDSSFKIDNTLTLSPEGVLSVNTADVVEKDNTLPVTSAAVHTQIGNIELLLQTI